MRSHLIASASTLLFLSVISSSVFAQLDGDLPPPGGIDGDLPIPSPIGGPDAKMQRLPEVVMESRALAATGNAYDRLYVEYNGIMYPLQGIVEVDGVAQATDGVARIMENDTGARVALGNRRFRSDARFIETNNKSLARGEFLLPTPRNPNNVFVSQFDRSAIPMGNAWALDFFGASAMPENDLLTRLDLTANFGLLFDTGDINANGDVSTIVLGSAPGAGQTTITGDDFVKDVPLSLLFDSQMMNVDLPAFPGQQAQVVLEANNQQHTDQLRFQSLYARVWDYNNLTLAAGKTESLFGTTGWVPASLISNATLNGTANLRQKNRTQLRLQTSTNVTGLAWGVAVEDPLDSDVAVTGTKLNRWPTFAGHVNYATANGKAEYRLAALSRTLGFQTGAAGPLEGTEHFAAAWGLSGYAKITTIDDACHKGGLLLGIAGGEGIGQYMHGLGLAAAFDGTNLNALKSFGSYVGYQYYWEGDRGWTWGTNIAYGYSFLDTPGFVAADTNNILNQAWVNFLVRPNKHMAFGFEYQYGSRETRAAGRGENNQFMLVVDLTTVPTTQATDTYMNSFGGRSGATSDSLGIPVGEAGAAFRQSL